MLLNLSPHSEERSRKSGRDIEKWAGLKRSQEVGVDVVEKGEINSNVHVRRDRLVVAPNNLITRK